MEYKWILQSIITLTTGITTPMGVNVKADSSGEMSGSGRGWTEK
jgi:hypothetical protein